MAILVQPDTNSFRRSRRCENNRDAVSMDAYRWCDLGCGDGAITVEMGRFARHVVGIDIDPRAVLVARKRAEREHRDNVTFKEDRIEKLQEPTGAYDLAVFSQSLHHLKNPEEGIRQSVRVLKKGGTLVVFDLAPHGELWVKEKLSHVHLGFAPESLKEMMAQAGLSDILIEQVHQRRGEVFRVLLATGKK